MRDGHPTPAFRFVVHLTLCLAVIAAPRISAQENGDMTGERIANARKEPQNWATYYGA